MITSKMTLSRDDRIRNMELAIRLMMEELGEKGITVSRADPRDSRYVKIYATTWQELERGLLVKPIRSASATWYQLTGDGWLQGLEVTQKLEETKEKVGMVMRELKRRVDDRKREVYVASWEIASAAGVSNSFLENMIESDFIRRVFRRQSLIANRVSGVGFGAYHFRIPINFGQEIL